MATNPAIQQRPVRFRVAIDNRGNPDYRQDAAKALPGTHADLLVGVVSLEHASWVCRRYIEGNDLGSGNWTGGDVFEIKPDGSTGRKIARVAYNGRVFDATTQKVLAEAADPTAFADAPLDMLRRTADSTAPHGSQPALTSADTATGQDAPAITLLFTRASGLDIDALAILTLKTHLDSQDKILAALKTAVSEWARDVPAGATLFAYAGSDINIGDLDSHAALSDPDLQGLLARQGIHEAKLEPCRPDCCFAFDTPLFDSEAAEDPPEGDADDDGPLAIQRYTLHTGPDGSISGTTWTNDNLDRGEPSQDAAWDVKYPNRAAMERATGKSHVGISGVRVEVILDGQRI